MNKPFDTEFASLHKSIVQDLYQIVKLPPSKSCWPLREYSGSCVQVRNTEFAPPLKQ